MDEIGIRLEPGEPGQGPRLRIVGVGRQLADPSITIRYPARGTILSLAGWVDDPDAKIRVTQQIVERDLLLTIPRRCANAIDPGTPVEIEIVDVGCFPCPWLIEEPLAVGTDTKSVMPPALADSSARAGAGPVQGQEIRQPAPKPDGSARPDFRDDTRPPAAADVQRRMPDVAPPAGTGPRAPVAPDTAAGALRPAWVDASNPPPVATVAPTAATAPSVGDSNAPQPAAKMADGRASDAWIGDSLPRQPAATAETHGVPDAWVGESIPIQRPAVEPRSAAPHGWTTSPPPPPPPVAPDPRYGAASAWAVPGYANQLPPFAAAAFHDPTEVTQWLRVLLCVSIAAHCLVFVSDLLDWLVLHLATFEPWMDAAGDSFYVRQDVIIILQLASFIIVGLLFLRWTYWANHNAWFLGARLSFTPGWAIGWYFIPVASLWKPYEAMQEIWQASRDPANWRAQRRTGLLPWWWFLLLLAGAMSSASCALRLRIIGDEGAIDDVFDMIAFGMSGAVASVGLAALTLVLIGQIFRMQMSHLRRS